VVAGLSYLWPLCLVLMASGTGKHEVGWYGVGGAVWRRMDGIVVACSVHLGRDRQARLCSVHAPPLSGTPGLALLLSSSGTSSSIPMPRCAPASLPSALVGGRIRGLGEEPCRGTGGRGTGGASLYPRHKGGPIGVCLEGHKLQPLAMPAPFRFPHTATHSKPRRRAPVLRQREGLGRHH
jgi:hypothetical protein